MKWFLQEKPFSCGPSALRNCLLFLNIIRSESYLRFLMGTTKNGTTEKGIIKSLEILKIPYNIVQTRSYPTFRKRLIKSLSTGPVILLVESGGHWVAATKYNKRLVEVIDSEYKLFNKSIKQSLKFNDLKQLAFNFDKHTLKSYYYFIAIKLSK